MRVDPATRTDRGLRRRRWTVGLTAVALAAAVGCGQSDTLPSYRVYEVKGRVLLATGKPLDGGWVYFVPKGDLPLTPSGVIGPDGTFSVVTGGSGEGAPAGDYKLRIEAPQYQTAKTRKPVIPTKYQDEDSSGLVVTVRAEPNHLDPIRLR
jgi:hypothetical protein